jgi:hypothetical protein
MSAIVWSLRISAAVEPPRGYKSQANGCFRERETVIQEATIRGAAQGSRVEKAGFTSHICHEHDDENTIPRRGRPDDKN